ncbi:MAG: mediator of RNA polymerase II transcription subunit 8 [Icmadophila ericetorum]|nr:mediator of RNA polymerase II transcription subunit 8 [Icmadophila ericetorum]
MQSSLSTPDVKVLEQARQRLFQLSNSLASLQHNITHADPSILSSSFLILSGNLSSLSKHLETHASLFSSMPVYPLPTFPGRTQENLLGQLLRKKLEPNVEDWVAEGKTIATRTGKGEGLKHEELRELWNWAGMAANEQARRHTWGGQYTIEERERGVENVITGLKKKLKDDDAEEEWDEDEEMEDDADEKMPEVETGPPLPINDVFRFMMTGVIPVTKT